MIEDLNEIFLIIDKINYDNSMVVDCPHCNFRWGFVLIDDIKPDKPMKFKCKRDRGVPCYGKWDIVVTEERYNKRQEAINKLKIAKNLLLEIKEGLNDPTT